MTDENTWPDCIGENVHALAKPVNWSASCARTQMRSGASLGTAGEALRVALLPVGSVNVEGDLGGSGMTGNQKFRLWRAAIFLAGGVGFYWMHQWVLGAVLVSIPLWSEFGEAE